MKELLRKNIVLVAILAISVTAAVVLLAMALNERSEWRKNEVEVRRIKEDIRSLNASDIYPIEENVKLIKKDIEDVKAKTEEMQSIYGRPFRKALKAFAAALDTTDSALAAAWDTFSNATPEAKEKVKNSPLQAVSDFLASMKHSEEKIQAAYSAFHAVLKETVSRPVTPQGLPLYLCAALGVHPIVSRSEAKTIADESQEALSSKLAEAGVAFPAKGVSGSRPTVLLFTEFLKLPEEKDIPAIFMHCWISDDLLSRMAEAKLYSYEDFSRTNGLYGELDKDSYRHFNYRVVVTGSMQSVRDYVNSLQRAVDKNIVYIVKSLSMSKVQNEAASLQTVKKDGGSPGEEPISRSGEIRARSEEELRSLQQKLSIKNVLGVSDLVKATIDLDCVVYEGKNKLEPVKE